MQTRTTRAELSEKEKIIWDEASALFEEILSDFNSKNLLRKGIKTSDITRLVKVWENSTNYRIMFNEVIEKFRTEEKAKKFAMESGLTPQTAFYLFMSQLIAIGLTAYESVFKTSLLFFIDTSKQKNLTKTLTLNPLT